MTLAILSTAMLATVGALLLIVAVQPKPGTAADSIFLEQSGGTVFLFDGDTLLDATPGARALLAVSQVRGDVWTRLHAYLAPRFPDFAARIGQLANEGRIFLAADEAQSEPLLLVAELRGGLTRITLQDPDTAVGPPCTDVLAQRALTEEVARLRDILSHAPLLVWREDGSGEVTWANAAYLMQAVHHLDPGEELSWPLPRVFPGKVTRQGATGQRLLLEPQGVDARWFDLFIVEETGSRLFFALPADAAVSAERALRDFMQTLSRTFAHLPIGLAIFDAERKLALFNPALLDLSGLPPDFLTLQPNLFAFLDAMRERNMIPEPKDYRGWRQRMAEMEDVSQAEVYEELWSLPSGQTYRVVGRPQSDGALALMFEDISGEMSRTRRFRAELELGQAVIDAMPEAIAVISQGGQLVMSNLAYAALWGHDPAAGLTETAIAALCDRWRGVCAPSPLWAEAEVFVRTPGERAPLQAEVRLLDGRLLACRFAALSGGATLASFQVVLAAEEAAALRIAARRSA